MSTEPNVSLQDPHHPRHTKRVIGHDLIAEKLEAAWHKNRLPHGIILSGPKGIGKATLAYQLARRLLAIKPSLNVHNVTDKQDIPTKTDHLIEANNHPDLCILEKVCDEKGKFTKDIPIEKARSLVTFFARTSITDGWRVAIIDAVEDLSTKGANALLKILEEPPAKCLIILISHNENGILPTLKSRCQLFSCRPLPEKDTLDVLSSLNLDEQPERLLPFCNGHPGLALDIKKLGGSAFLTAFERVIAECQNQDFRHLFSFLNQYIIKPVTAFPDQAYHGFCRFLQHWMAMHLLSPELNLSRERVQKAKSFYKIQTQLKITHIFSLDRKQTLLCVFYEFFGYGKP